MFDPQRPGPDYTLRWPPELFVREARVFAQQPVTVAGWSDEVGWLLRDAFVTDQPADDFDESAKDTSAWDPAFDDPGQLQFLNQLIGAASTLPQEKAPRPYYPARQVAHAIALYRARDADTEAKRSACIALFGVLESRRELLKDKLSRKDEGALFQIANEFQIRHRNAKQKVEYDVAYLDWIFWWCLATVELSNRLINRQDQGS